MLTLELAVVAILIVINGFLAMAELAIVSSRPARLKMMADQGTSGARRALALSENPGRFLSTVQIGITLVGVLSGMALVHDEYGHFEGVATQADIFETITGVFRADTGEHDPPAFRREDGSWLLSGHLPADEMADHLGLTLPPERDYQTLAGFLLAQLQHMPSVGDAIDAQGWRFEVVDIDGRRIDKVLAAKKPRRGISR